MPELQLRHPVDDVVRTAVRGALPTTIQNGQTHTADLFAALAEADVHGRWERFWLACGYPTLSRIRAAADPADATDSEFRRWRGLFLTSFAARALNLADALCRAYDRDEIDIGLLALALVSDPGAGAATVLLDSSKLMHKDLLTVVQSELVGSDLADLHTVLAEFRADPTSAASPFPPRASTVAAAEDLLEPRQLDRTPPPGAASSRPADVVAVLASSADLAIAAMISRWLTDEGATVVDSGSTGAPMSSAVVLASRAAVADPVWQTAAENLQCDRLIPVRIDDVPAETLPPAVAEWNWVEWSDDDVHNRTAISTALRNDIRDFRATKALQSEAPHISSCRPPSGSAPHNTTWVPRRMRRRPPRTSCGTTSRRRSKGTGVRSGTVGVGGSTAGSRWPSPLSPWSWSPSRCVLPVVPATPRPWA
jgi:hypothetical protein